MMIETKHTRSTRALCSPPVFCGLAGFVLSAVVLLGCSTTDLARPIGLETHRSGTELIARTISGHPTSFFDMQLGFNCEFVDTLNGGVRCLPEKEAPLIGFSDPNCRVPVALGPLTEGDVIRVRRGICDGSVSHAFHVGPQVSFEVHFKTEQGCSDAGYQGTAHSLQVLPNEMFVSAERQTHRVNESLTFVPRAD